MNSSACCATCLADSKQPSRWLQSTAWWSPESMHHCHQTGPHAGSHMPVRRAGYVVCLLMQLICMAKKRGTKVINVVRRADVVQELKDLGYATLMSRLPASLDGIPGCFASITAGPCAERSVNITFASGCPKLRLSRSA